MTSPAGREFAAIIAAAGSGTRFAGQEGQAGRPKQFLNLRGLPLYAWSLLAISRHHLISSIVLSTPLHMVQTMEAEIRTLSAQHDFSQNLEVIAGGATRQDSVFRGLQKLALSARPPDYVLVHDAARPFLDFATVERAVAKAIEYGACTVATPVSDTIKRVNGGKVVETIPREDLFAVQTPQAGRFSQLIRAHQEAERAGFASTDDAALLEWAGHDVYVVDGPQNNLKVTQPLDLILAEALADYLFKDRL